jgi:hypothetical protein
VEVHTRRCRSLEARGVARWMELQCLCSHCGQAMLPHNLRLHRLQITLALATGIIVGEGEP